MINVTGITRESTDKQAVGPDVGFEPSLGPNGQAVAFKVDASFHLAVYVELSVAGGVLSDKVILGGLPQDFRCV